MSDATTKLVEALSEALEDWGDTWFDTEYPPRFEWAQKANEAIRLSSGRDIFTEWKQYEEKQEADHAAQD